MSAANLLVIIGPTASGKTSLAVKLAQHYHAEIISADSRQVFRGLDIGSGKDLHEYQGIPYHLIDIVDPGYEFNLFEYQKAFCLAYQSITTQNKLPMLVGGTGLYLDAILSNYQLTQAPENQALRRELANKSMAELRELLEGLKPNLHNTTDLLQRTRLIRSIEILDAEKNSDNTALTLPAFTPLIVGIRWERATLKKRIHHRLLQRLEEGLIEEVRALNNNGVSWDTLHYYGLEYRYVARYLQGELNRNDMVQKLNSAICTFAKQQEKWFRRFEKKGKTIHWLNGTENLLEQALKVSETQL
ncbi:tRNA dimethylallyltransferase [Alteromonadaceae bacterium Bs31]|nr:tRNA dimethylallyltransferase [Alteromonadaceae bacterium Bs31]